MKTLIGIIIGISIMLVVGSAYASNKVWHLDQVGAGDAEVIKIQDGSINCYIYRESYLGYKGFGGISCLKTK